MATKFGKVKANMLTNDELASKHLSTTLGLRKKSEDKDDMLIFSNENRINPTDETNLTNMSYLNSSYIRA